MLGPFGKLIQCDKKRAKQTMKTALLHAELDGAKAARFLGCKCTADIRAKRKCNIWIKRLGLRPWVDAHKRMKQKSIRTGNKNFWPSPKHPNDFSWIPK